MKATPTTLGQMLDMGEDHVRKILLELKEPALQPFYHLESPAGGGVVACDFDSPEAKEGIAAAVAQLARKMGATLAMFVSEAWMVVVKREDYDEDGPPPSQRPDRVEVVTLIATDGAKCLTRTLTMIRGEAGEVVDLRRMHPNDDLGAGGRMIDGIIKPPITH